VDGDSTLVSFQLHHPLIRAEKPFGLLNKPLEKQLTNLHLCKCVNKILASKSTPDMGDIFMCCFFIFTVKVDLASCKNE